MLMLDDLLAKAKAGELEGCKGCPRHPKTNGKGKIGFACSCPKHLGGSDSPVMIVLQDPPASKGAALQTKVICYRCNSDPTARNMKCYMDQAFLKKSGLLDKDIYLTNAVLHGRLDKQDDLNTSKEHCKWILKSQVEAINPCVIITLGEHATKSLHSISDGRVPLNRLFTESVAKSAKWRIGQNVITVIPLFHPSRRGTVNAGGREKQLEYYGKAGEIVRGILKGARVNQCTPKPPEQGDNVENASQSRMGLTAVWVAGVSVMIMAVGIAAIKLLFRDSTEKGQGGD